MIVLLSFLYGTREASTTRKKKKQHISCRVFYENTAAICTSHYALDSLPWTLSYIQISYFNLWFTSFVMPTVIINFHTQ